MEFVIWTGPMLEDLQHAYPHTSSMQQLHLAAALDASDEGCKPVWHGEAMMETAPPPCHSCAAFQFCSGAGMPGPGWPAGLGASLW